MHANPTQTTRLIQILTLAANTQPAAAWDAVATELAYLVRNQPLASICPALAQLLADVPRPADAGHSDQLALMISRAASQLRPAARLELWHELWVLLNDEPIPAALAATINTLPDLEIRI